MHIDDKVDRAIRALVRLDRIDRKNAQQRRRACYWIKRVRYLEWKQQAGFREELWESIFTALDTGKIQSLHVIG